MKFKTIYNRSILFWPDRIDFSDGKFIEETNGFNSKTLSSALHRAEDLATNEWESLMVWVLYVEIHSLAKKYFKQKNLFVKVSEIDLLLIQGTFLEILKEEEYKEMLSQFEL